jgi:hypothetical protein
MTQSVYTAGMLRSELLQRGLALSKRSGLLHEMSHGANSSLVFGLDEGGRHGNFHEDSFACIRADPDWRLRLTKVHTAAKRERVRANWRWMELDSVNSSDALLMNIFCHPAITGGGALSSCVASLLGIDIASRPRFGIVPGVPLKSGRTDRTEIDLQIGNLFIEAKLTESGFQQAQLKTLERYAHFEAVFDVGRLPWNASGNTAGYQLIRNVLAAYATDSSFCVLADSRRRDLAEVWYSVMSAVQLPGFSWRLKLLTWQELANTLPPALQCFLEAKYGIVPRVTRSTWGNQAEVDRYRFSGYGRSKGS